MVEDRIAALEDRVARLEAGVPAAREWRRADAVPSYAPAERPQPSALAWAPAPPKPLPRRTRRDLEDFVGGSLLAWLGGVAVLAGLAFLLTIAVSRGWIGEGARTALAGVLSAGLLGAGGGGRGGQRPNPGAFGGGAGGLAPAVW